MLLDLLYPPYLEAQAFSSRFLVFSFFFFFFVVFKDAKVKVV